MNPSSRRGKMSAEVSASTQQRLNSYALAAGAAGVGVLALAQPAEAKIVYTAAHHVIGRNSRYILDLNHDGKGDFIISNEYSCVDSCNTFLVAKPTKGTQGVAGHYNVGHGFAFAYALRHGATVGPKVPFSAFNMVEGQSGGACSGQFGSQWCNVKNRYLGFRFKIHGRTHYGWARVSTNGAGGIKAILTGYAYETIPNKPIIAGKTKGSDDSGIGESHAALAAPTSDPVTLGMLALGSPSLSIWRRKESMRVPQ